MVDKARNLILALTLLLGLVFPHELASKATYARAGNGPPPALAASAAPESPAPEAQSRRVVSRKNDNAQRDDKTRRPRRAKGEEEARPAGPMDVFADIERAWNGRKADPILAHFGKGKVAISLDGKGGKFSKSQSYYLLKDMFKYTITKKFEFVQYRKPGEKGNTTFAVAERHYQRTDDGRLFKDKIYVALHLEGGDGGRWVVDEIKSIR